MQTLMIEAHAEARTLVARKGYSYREAMKIGLRRAHNTAQHKRLAASHPAKAPQFMWLRGF